MKYVIYDIETGQVVAEVTGDASLAHANISPGHSMLEVAGYVPPGARVVAGELVPAYTGLEP